MSTPAQEAREYAAANGFTITPEGRRYRIVGHGLDTTVGGYPAALNAMKRWPWVDTLATQWVEKTSQEIVDNMLACAEHMGASKTQALGFVGTLLKATPAFEHVVGTPKHWRISYASIVNPGTRPVYPVKYNTRSDALRVVRRMLSDPTSTMRKRHVTIEYVS